MPFASIGSDCTFFELLLQAPSLLVGLQFDEMFVFYLFLEEIK